MAGHLEICELRDGIFNKSFCKDFVQRWRQTGSETPHCEIMKFTNKSSPARMCTSQQHPTSRKGHSLHTIYMCILAVFIPLFWGSVVPLP